MTIFSAALLLFLVMDPFGNIPFYITALKNVDPSRHTMIIVRELLIALAVLLIFLFAGQQLLDAVHISEPALTTAGGTILFLIAIRMIFPASKSARAEEIHGEPFIVPLAIPYVAGPSAMATVLFVMNQEPNRWPEWLLALMGAWLVTGLIIVMSSKIGRFLGQRGMIAMERLMGMLLVAIAIQMLMTGIRQFIGTFA
jgi:multiple antibiotic resistance protein